MKLSRIAAAALCAVLCVSFSACAEKSAAEPNETAISSMEEKTVKTVIADSSNVKQLGRTYLMDDTLWLAFSGTGVDFSYTGKKLNLDLVGDGVSEVKDNNENYARFAVYVDGERVVDEVMDQPAKTVTAFESDEAKTVNVKVVKLSEAAMSTMGIKPITIAGDETIVPTEPKAHKIEFVGDSITCGYGVDDEDENHHFSTATEDVTKAYAYKTAEALDADYSMVSLSGHGIISGWTDNPNEKKPKQIMPLFYNKVGFSYGQFAKTKSPSALTWEFSDYVPDVVVINLGTNDDSYCKNDAEKQQEYTDAYVEFLKKIRDKNPDATIFCTLGIMGQNLFPAVQKAADAYTAETGDTNIHTFMFSSQDGSLGYAADWHPTAATHDKAAEELTAEIKSVMGW